MLCMCSMFGVDVVYVFHVWCGCYVCVPCLVLMLCMCSMFGVDVVNVFHVWCGCCTFYFCCFLFYCASSNKTNNLVIDPMADPYFIMSECENRMRP